MLAKSKLSSIDTLISQALIDLDISHEEFFRKKIFFSGYNIKSEILLSILYY